MPTWWLSFADDDGFRGAVLVDGCDDFQSAHRAASLAGANPGGEVLGVAIDVIPEDHAEAFAALPRLTVLTKEQLRVLAPLENQDGEPR